MCVCRASVREFVQRTLSEQWSRRWPNHHVGCTRTGPAYRRTGQSLPGSYFKFINPDSRRWLDFFLKGVCIVNVNTLWGPNSFSSQQINLALLFLNAFFSLTANEREIRNFAIRLMRSARSGRFDFLSNKWPVTTDVSRRNAWQGDINFRTVIG